MEEENSFTYFSSRGGIAMHPYEVAQLNENQVKQLNEYQNKFSEQLGKDIILIAYNDDETDK